MNRSLSVVIWFGLIIGASVVLYNTSNHVHELQQELRQTNNAIQQERQSLHVMKAEWNYLANPARIEALTSRHLALAPSVPQQIASMNELNEIIPTRPEAMASVNIESSPIANLRASLAVPAPKAVVASMKRAAKVQHLAKANASNEIAGEHVTEHMNMPWQRTASAAPTPHSIGDLLAQLDGR